MSEDIGECNMSFNSKFLKFPELIFGIIFSNSEILGEGKGWKVMNNNEDNMANLW